MATTGDWSWPPAGTATWPPVGTFSWPRTDCPASSIGRAASGSSPLARGGLDALDRAGRAARLIPARAGRTAHCRRRRARGPAHPRSRGADFTPLIGPMTTAGSSPLARGGRRVDPVRAQVVGLIPARAGRTHRRSSAPETTTAHPRSRGADAPSRRSARTRRGSSPLARGGRVRSRLHRCWARLIPARAGRTRSWRRPRSMATAHPRSRGADSVISSAHLSHLGSSPLARGGLPLPVRHLVGPRLIPARAGRTRRGSRIPLSAPAHPRSRGADHSSTGAQYAASGSSPLARGGPAAHQPRHA